MFKFDHFVINVDKSYQKDKDIISNIINSGFPYNPACGKGTKGFKASNLWIGNEYFEMINILKFDGGGWKTEWVDLYNAGHRGLICIMLDVANIQEVYKLLKKRNIEITKPEYLKYKWFFNIFTKTMPWQNSYINFFEGIPLQIGLQQINDEKSHKFMEEYMVPNSSENNIMGISKIIVRGYLSLNDKKLIHSLFDTYITKIEPLTIELNQDQTIIFENSENYKIQMFTKCDNENFNNKSIFIENISIINTK